MAQWTVIRMAIARNRDIAELYDRWPPWRKRSWMAPINCDVEQFLAENVWAAFHIWDRTQRGSFSRKGTFELTCGPTLMRPAPDRAWRDPVARRQECGLHSDVRRRRRCGARAGIVGTHAT